MADSDLSLLFKLRGDASGLKTATAEGRAAINQLKQSFGPELTQTINVANRAFASASDSLTSFVTRRLPVGGGVFASVAEGLRGVSGESIKAQKAANSVAQSIQSIATQSGKSVPQITAFLAKFTQLEGQAKKNDAAFKFFGGSIDLIGNRTAKFVPELQQAEAGLAAIAAESATTSSAIAGMVGPVGIAVAAFAALAVGSILLAKEIFALAKSAAAFQGKLYDLSQQTGVSVETLSALEVVARTTGGSIDGLVQSLGIFQRHLEEAQDSNSKAAKTFRQLGVETADTEQALRQTIAALARMPAGFRQTALALEVFGRGGKAFLAIAKEANGDIDEITRRLGKLGLVTTEQAKIADEFNDQLVILDVQMRGLGTKAIPVVLDVLRDMSKVLEENRDVFTVLQGSVKGLALSIAVPLKFAVANIIVAWKAHLIAITPIIKAFQLLKDLAGAIPPVQIPVTTAPSGKSVTQQIEEEVRARKALQGALIFEFAQRKRLADDAIAQAQREFAAGKSNREQLLQAVLLNNRKKAQADIDALKIERGIRANELALTKDDLDKQQQLSNAVVAIDVQIADKQAELRRTQQELTAKSRADEQKDLLTHEQTQLEILTRGGQARIAIIEQEIAEGVRAREEGLAEIERIENAALVARGQLLKKELQLAGIGPDRQVVLDKIKALEADRTALEQQQAERRKQIARAEAATKREIASAGIDALLEVEAIRAERLIAASEALAEARVQSEEAAARRILAIRLRLIDSEIEATKAKLKAAATITDTDERLRAEADLNNRLRILREQRVSIETQGERDIDTSRQRDLENERRYAEELEEIRQDTIDAERDAAEEVIRLMEATFARRRDIIRAERDLELLQEDDRHRHETERINQQKRATDEEIRILEKRLERLKVGTTEEIEEHDRLIASLERLRQKRAELERQQEAEDERSKTRKRRVKTDADKDEKEADPLERIKIGTENIKQFARELEQTVVPLGEILARTFGQVADAIGQTVANWVLLGTTGPAVMRKILAQALASIAAEAAVNTVKELALGFATLFFNPAESAAHFTAAGLWAAIGGVSALAGRAVAGNLFQPAGGGAGGRGGGGGGARDTEQPRPIDLIRESLTQELHVFVHTEPGGRFNEQVVVGVIDDVRSNGPMRTTIKEAGKD